MGREVFRRTGVVLSLSFLFGLLSASTAEAQYNTNGFIRSNGWNMLFLDQGLGCDAGGLANQQVRTWAAPHDIGKEDPKAGDVWADIAFGGGALSRSWTLPPLGASPTWVSVDSLTALGVTSVPVGDIVDFDTVLERIRVFPDPDLATAVKDNAITFATTYVRNKTGTDLVVQIGSTSDDSGQVYLNDLQVGTRSDCRGVQGDFEVLNTVVLPTGISKISALVWEGGGGHGLRLGIVKDGVRLADGNDFIDFLGTGAGDPTIVGQIQGTDPITRKYCPEGWIVGRGWNFLSPLDNPGGGTGGGELAMLDNWTHPRDIVREDPKSGDLWDIDFSRAASEGNAAGQFTDAIGLPSGDKPIWYTWDDLEQLIGSLNPAILPLFGEGSGRNPYGQGLVNLDDLYRQLNVRVATPNGLPGIDGGLNPCPGVRLDGTADLGAWCDPDNLVSIATTYVLNSTGADLPVVVASSTDDSCQVWVNCQLVTNMSHGRGAGRFATELRPAVLPPGISKIALLVFEGGGGHGFRLGLRPVGSSYNYSDGNDQIEFLGHGSGNPAIVGSKQFCLERLASSQLVKDSVKVTIKGNGEGDGSKPIQVVERLSAADLDSIQVTDISHGGAYEPTVAMDAYVNISSTGGDIWADCDSFQFDYELASGDFDISVELLSATHSTPSGNLAAASSNRHGKYGLMARAQLDRGGIYQMVQDQLASRVDGIRNAVRRNLTGGDACDRTAEIGGQGPGPNMHPRFIRLQRVGGVISAWGSNNLGLADGSLDPRVDANWFLINRQTWPDTLGNTDPNDDNLTLPADMYVGFANSEHNSGGVGLQRIVYRVLPGSTQPELTGSQTIGTDNGGRSRSFRGNVVVEAKVVWNTSQSSANEGLSYTVRHGEGYVSSAGDHLGFNPPVSGVVDGPPINPRRDSFYYLFQPDQAGPVGIFENALDVGTSFNPPTAGSTTFDGTTYTVSGSGADIWDTGDYMQFAYRAVTGDFVATARVTEVTNPPNARWGRLGVMARYTPDYHSKYSMACVPYRGEDPVNNDSRRHQSRRDHLTTATTRDEQELPALLASPVTGWVRLTRKGNYFYSQFADDVEGAPGPWAFAGGDTHINPPETFLVGLVASAHGTAGAGLLKVSYDNVSIGPLAEAPQLTCGELGPVIEEPFDVLDPATSLAVLGGGTFTPAAMGGKLRLTQDGIGNSATAVWFNVDGLTLADTGFRAEFDAFMSKGGTNFDANPADGMTFAVIEGDFSTAAGQVGGAGGSSGYQRYGENQIPALRRKSFAIELDNWNGGHGTNDPSRGGANNGPDSYYHLAIDFNENMQSAQNTEERAAPLPSLYLVPDGIHVEVQYSPAGYTSQIDVWVASNNDSFARRNVLSAIGPRLNGNIFLGFTSGTGGASAHHEIDNLSVTELCCEAADSASIAQQAPVDLVTQNVVTLDGSASSGGDGAFTYSWQVVSGNAQLIPPADGPKPQLRLTGSGSVTVKLSVSDGSCDDTASAQMSFDVSCTDPAEVAIITAPAGLHEIGSTVVVDSAGSSAGSRLWSVLSGPGVIVGPANGDTASIRGTAKGDVVVRLSVDDGACSNPGSAEATLRFDTLVNWVRCDCNGDKLRDVSDAVFHLTWLFVGGATPACQGSCDCNSDAGFDVSDAIYDLNYQFTGGPPPASPYPACDNFAGCATNC